MQPLRPSDSMENKAVTLLLNSEQTGFEELAAQVNQLQILVNSTITSPATFATPQAVNQLRNGSYSHSWKSWFNTAAVDNSRYQCYPWYSQPSTANQPMYPQNTADGNKTITFTDTDVNVAGNRVQFAADHWLVTGTALFLTSASPPAPLVTNTFYYAIVTAPNRIKFATTVANAIAGTNIVLTTTGGAVTNTLAFNYTLKQSSDTEYSSAFSIWDWPTGTAQFEGTNDISTLVGGRNIDPSYSYFLTFNIVRASQYIACGPDVRIAAGLYAHSTALAAWDWIYGEFLPTATVVGTVATPTSRDYVIQAVTDRGFTVQSTPLTVANAPSDADFSGGARVVISWPQVLNYGVISYDIYRKTGAAYKLLISIVTGQLSYIDNNGGASVAGYPSFTFNSLVAFTATQNNVIASLPYSGDPLFPSWPGVSFAIKTPQNYNKSDTILADGQWLRMYLQGLASNGRLDIRVTDGVVVNGDKTIDSASGQFTAEQVGLDILITDGVNIFPSTIGAYTSATEIEINDTPDFDATAATLYITGGASADALWIDLTHLDYIEGGGFAPNAEDILPIRGIPPVTPNGTTQSGGGPGNTGYDGSIVCLYEEEIVTTQRGDIPIKLLKHHDLMPDGYGGFNRVVKIEDGVSDVWLIETANGASLKSSPSKQVYIADNERRTMAQLQAGDTVLTYENNNLVPSTITVKHRIFDRTIVRQISLKPGHSFLAGTNIVKVLVDNNKPPVDPEVN